MEYAQWVLKGRLNRKKMLENISGNSRSTGANLSTLSSASSSISGDQNSFFQNEKRKINGKLCSDETKYVKLLKVGEGTYGKVYKACHKENPDSIVALKAVVAGRPNEPIPETILREIIILKMLNHENILKFIDVCRSSGTSPYRSESHITLVTEYCEHDLSVLLNNPNVHFKLGEIKMLMQQLFLGIAYIHRKNILHRDLKTPNLLVTKTGTLKLADFGLARSIKKRDRSEKKCLTNLVATLWYRSPELLLGEENYGPPIDNWSAGCIMAEMWIRKPIMMGGSEQQQLKFISRLCGSIAPKVWPEVVNLYLYNKFFLPENMKNRIIDYLMPFVKDTHACNLIQKLLILDPRKRITAVAVLQDEFFTAEPLPCDLRENLLNFSRNSSQLKIGFAAYHYGQKRKRERDDSELMHDRIW